MSRSLSEIIASDRKDSVAVPQSNVQLPLNNPVLFRDEKLQFRPVPPVGQPPVSKLVILLGRVLSVDEDKLLSDVGMLLFKFDSKINSNLTLKDLLEKFDGVVIDMLDEKSIAWYSEFKHQLAGCKVVYVAQQGTSITNRIPVMKQNLGANVVLKYLPQTAMDKYDLIEKLHDHISRAGTKSKWDVALKLGAKLLSCVLN